LHEKSKFTQQGLPYLSATVFVAQKMAKELGASKVLLEALCKELKAT
tara:strand:- start:186 stop:326 length:141 start_codon:yes stop_codon:yes gene_type:complete